jgi:hypothetical protein
LNDPAVQWELYKSMLNQESNTKKIDYYGKITGEIRLEKGESISDAIDLIKAKAKKKSKNRGGELDLIKSLSGLMSETFQERIDKMNRDINEIIKGAK